MKRKDFMILLAIVSVIGAILYYEQILAIFRGMSPLEALKTIVTFVLHVSVTAIVSYVAISLPKITRPWLKALRSQRRRVKRQPAVQQQPSPRAPRLTSAQILQLLASQSPTRSKPAVPHVQQQNDTPLEF